MALTDGQKAKMAMREQNKQTPFRQQHYCRKVTAEIARHRFQQINPDHSGHSWKNPPFQDNTSPTNITRVANTSILLSLSSYLS